MDPGFTIRTAQVITRFPGASPERVEALVTDRIETAIQQLPELDFVTSTSKTGLSIVSANIRNEFTDMRPIWDNLRRKVDEAARELPDGARPPQVNDEFGDVYGTIVAITGVVEEPVRNGVPVARPAAAPQPGETRHRAPPACAC